MHLPKEVRRRLTYVTAFLAVFGSFTYAWKHHTAAKKPALLASHVPGPQEVTDGNAPAAKAPAIAEAKEQKSEQKPKAQTYKVAAGDTISGIAAKFGLKADTILASNDLDENDTIRVGQELQIPAVDGLLYEVANGDSLWQIAADHGVSMDDIAKANPELDPSAISPGQKLLLPGGEAASRRQVASRGASIRSGSHQFSTWPAYGPITDPFGWRVHPVYGTSSFHDGMDIGVGSGTPLVSVAAGTVVAAGRNGGYGLIVRIDHGGGMMTEYAHMSQVDVAVGDKVKTGQHLGYSGNTGVSTGPHLHFMVLVDGTPSDPMSWLP